MDEEFQIKTLSDLLQPPVTEKESSLDSKSTSLTFSFLNHDSHE
jgi:hypothetical protein